MIFPIILLPLILFIHPSIGCLPSGGGLFGGSTSNNGCGQSGCASSSYVAPSVSSYSYSPQVSYQPLPPVAPPPPPAYSPALPSYQGQYLDRPQQPVTPYNPAYQGRAPLGFPGSPSGNPQVSASEDSAPTMINPLQYLEHVSVSHVPANEQQKQETREYQSAPADPFSNIPIISASNNDKPIQIQVAPSSSITVEDQYYSAPERDNTTNKEDKDLVTYYNQICSGEKIATGEKETINSATKKCELLKCVAANAIPDSQGTYIVTYLRTANTRTNKKGNYCLSSKELPVKSKRVIRRFEDMMTEEKQEETKRARRLLRHRRI